VLGVGWLEVVSLTSVLSTVRGQCFQVRNATIKNGESLRICGEQFVAISVYYKDKCEVFPGYNKLGITP
jgi:hypothetical protein